jgi:hypothetical protein
MVFKLALMAVLLALGLTLLPMPGIVQAADTSGARYQFTIRVSNNGTVDAYNVTVPITINTSAFVDGGYVWSNLTNSAMITNQGMNGYYNPAVVTNTTWMFLVPYVPSNSNIDYSLYMGGDPMGGNLSFVPGAGGYLTAADSANLELGNSFSIIGTGVVDVGNITAGKNLVNKPGALVLNLTSVNQISATFTAGYGNPVGGVGSLNLNNGGNTRSGFRLTNFPGGTLTSVGFALWKGNAPTGTAHITVRKSSDDGLIGNISSLDVSTLTPSAYTWVNFSGTPIYTAESDIRIQVEYYGGNSTNYIGVSLGNREWSTIRAVKYTGSYDPVTENLYQVRGNLTFLTTKNVTANASGFSFASNKTAVTLNGNVLMQPYCANITDNSSAWYFAQNRTMPVLRTLSVVVGNNPRLTLNPAWQNSAIFYDASGYNNDVTPVFGTSGSHPAVSAALLTMKAENQAIASNWTLESYTTNAVGTMPGTPPEMFDELSPVFPGHSIPDEIAAEADVPVSLFWFLIPIIIILILGMIIHNVTKSLMAQAAVIAICVLLVSLMHIWPLWMLIPYCMMAGAAVLAGKVYSY